MKKVIAFISNRFKVFISFVKKAFSRDHKSPIDSLEELIPVIQNDLSKLILMDKDQKFKTNEDIKKMISYYNQLTDQIEARRGRLVESSWQTMTILVAASGILLALKIPVIFLFPALVIFFIQLIFSIAKLYEYRYQSAFKYPFINTDYDNNWKWFYHANPFIEMIDHNPFQNEQRNHRNLNAYLKGLHYFIDNYANETIDKELSNNIQQLYLLQVHNFYKNKFFLRLNNYDILANHVSFTLLSIFLGILLGYWIFPLIK